ncbi:MAG: YkgJ family cysteine cluster protein, partial [Bdellovibrionota bacterium]
YLNEERRCSIYERRPETCRNHPKIGPRPNFCPYQKKGLS